MELTAIIFDFLVTFLASLAFGIQRQKSHKPIGFGTFTLVSVGACALSIIAELLSPENPLSLMGAIMTGIGFLGAGAMIKSNDKTRQITGACCGIQ